MYLKEGKKKREKENNEKPTKKWNTSRVKLETSKGKIRYITKWRETRLSWLNMRETPNNDECVTHWRYSSRGERN